MRISLKSFIILLLTGTSVMARAQEDLYYDQGFVRNDNAIYTENIRTVLLYKMGFELSPPIIQLASDDRLVLAFDDLDGGNKPYKYTLIHCDAFWNPSPLQQMEYLVGFFEDDIVDFKYSFNTTVSYTNYVLVFPNENLRITKSGNYILKVFLDRPDDENVVLTHRFMVYEPFVDVKGRVTISMDLNLRYTHQQVSFKVLAGNYPMTDTHRDLHVTVMQNGRWDSMLQNIQPRSIVGGELDFSLVPELVFPAGNEFRQWDMKTLQYNTERMHSIRFTERGYEVFLQNDEPRVNRNYLSEEDINGRRLIAVNYAQDSYTEGDYAWVHFTLPYPGPLAEGSLYIGGAFNNWQYTRENLLRYDEQLRVYRTSLFLKQGYYNYCYAFVPNNANTGLQGFIDGDFQETENEYAVLIYHRRQGNVHDSLVGVGFMNSHE